MIQKFGGVLEPAYQFTDKFEELPPQLLTNIQPLAVDWNREPFVAACWIHNFLTSGKTFVLITRVRVIYKDPIRVTQNMLGDVTGVERSRLGNNILVLSPGNKNSLFPTASTKPGDKLMRLLFDVINQTWVSVRQGVSGGGALAAGQPSSGAGPSSIAQQIEELNGLKERGILTEAEFQQKKQELLARL